MATKKLTKWCIVRTHEVFESIELTVHVDQRRVTNLLGRKAPSSFFFFFLSSERDPKFTPRPHPATQGGLPIAILHRAISIVSRD